MAGLRIYYFLTIIISEEIKLNVYFFVPLFNLDIFLFQTPRGQILLSSFVCLMFLTISVLVAVINLCLQNFYFLENVKILHGNSIILYFHKCSMDTENKKSCTEFKIIQISCKSHVSYRFCLPNTSQLYFLLYILQSQNLQPKKEVSCVQGFGVSRFRFLWNLKSSRVGQQLPMTKTKGSHDLHPHYLMSPSCGFCCHEACGPTKLIFSIWLSFVSNTSQEVKLLEGHY